jgi:DNA-binding HxlR family transcriptional regulator
MDIRRAVPGISQRMLTVTLRHLERDGIVERTAYPPAHLWLHLTI